MNQYWKVFAPFCNQLTGAYKNKQLRERMHPQSKQPTMAEPQEYLERAQILFNQLKKLEEEHNGLIFTNEIISKQSSDDDEKQESLNEYILGQIQEFISVVESFYEQIENIEETLTKDTAYQLNVLQFKFEKFKEGIRSN